MNAQDAILVGIVIIQILDTAVLFRIMGVVDGFKARIEALEEWRHDLARRM